MRFGNGVLEIDTVETVTGCSTPTAAAPLLGGNVVSLIMNARCAIQGFFKNTCKV